jgi:hypothetical protein
MCVCERDGSNPTSETIVETVDVADKNLQGREKKIARRGPGVRVVGGWHALGQP